MNTDNEITRYREHVKELDRIHQNMQAHVSVCEYCALALHEAYYWANSDNLPRAIINGMNILIHIADEIEANEAMQKGEESP